LSALTAVLVGGIVFSVANVYIPVRELQETNQKTFERIHCDGQSCDVGEIASDWEFTGADYVLDKETYFLLNVEEPTADFPDFSLHRSDPEFVLRFQSPASETTPARESWRLCSGVKQIGSRRVPVMVGYAEHASWKLDMPLGSMDVIDEKLKEQVTKLGASLRESNGRLDVPSAATRKIADAYEIVDLVSHQILHGGYWIPVYLPRDTPLPSEGIYFRLHNAKLYVTKVDANERLLAASSASLGAGWSLVALFVLVFLVAGAAAYLSGTTFLRKYFVLSQTRPKTVDEAVKVGEGPTIEFKRSISFDIPDSVEQVLQTVAAFANSDDGTIFVGIEDDSKIKGLKIEGPKQKDHLSQRIYQAVRQRIKPSPWIQVEFVEVRGFTLCTIFVPRGEDPLHFLDGVIFVRYGASDIKAEPEIVKRLLTAYAF